MNRHCYRFHWSLSPIPAIKIGRPIALPGSWTWFNQAGWPRPRRGRKAHFQDWVFVIVVNNLYYYVFFWHFPAFSMLFRFLFLSRTGKITGWKVHKVISPSHFRQLVKSICFGSRWHFPEDILSPRAWHCLSALSVAVFFSSSSSSFGLICILWSLIASYGVNDNSFGKAEMRGIKRAVIVGNCVLEFGREKMK